MAPAFIDPIKVREERERLSKAAVIAQDGMRGADALLWFNEHAKPQVHAEAVLTVSAAAIASSTPNAQYANAYIAKAAKGLLTDILVRAMELARLDFDRAERARKAV